MAETTSAAELLMDFVVAQSRKIGAALENKGVKMPSSLGYDTGK